MAKVTGVKKTQAALASVFPTVFSASNMKRYGQIAADMTRLRTRLGDGVAKDGDQKQKLKALAESTILSRESAQAAGSLSSLTTPKRSNLTRSGQLLDALQPADATVGRVVVDVKGQRTDGKTNEDIAKYVTEQGRGFNNLSKIETKRLRDTMRRDLSAHLKKQLTNG